MLTGPSLTIKADMPVFVDVQNFRKLLRLLIAVTCSKHSPTTIGQVRRLDEAPAAMQTLQWPLERTAPRGCSASGKPDRGAALHTKSCKSCLEFGVAQLPILVRVQGPESDFQKLPIPVKRFGQALQLLHTTSCIDKQNQWSEARPSLRQKHKGKTLSAFGTVARHVWWREGELEVKERLPQHAFTARRINASLRVQRRAHVWQWGPML